VPGGLGVEVAVNAPFDDFDTAPWLLPVMPPTQQQADDYQRDAIAGAQSEEAFEANKREYSK